MTWKLVAVFAEFLIMNEFRFSQLFTLKYSKVCAQCIIKSSYSIRLMAYTFCVQYSVEYSQLKAHSHQMFPSP